MSARNILIIESNKTTDDIYKKLYNLIKMKECGIIFEPKDYWEPILFQLNCNNNYFTITEDKTTIECGGIFETVTSFEYAITFSKKEFKKREKEFLHRKLSFFDDIIDIIFSDKEVQKVEMYLCTEYSITLDDFDQVIEVNNGRLCDAIIGSYECTKKEKYYGCKTRKFVINNYKE